MVNFDMLFEEPPPPPVTLGYRLSSVGRKPLVGAEVVAFRTMLLARGTSDSDGKLTLTFPLSLVRLHRCSGA